MQDSTRPASFDDELQRIRSKLRTDPKGALAAAEALLPVRQDPRLFRLAAEACRALGLTDDATDAEIAAIQASLSDPRLREAAMAQAEDRAEDSLGMAEAALAAEPDDLLAQTLVAEAALTLWQLDRAEAGLRQVLDRAPTFLRASMLLVTCLVRQVRARDACDVLERAIALKPNNLTVLSRLAQLRATVRDVDQAVQLYERLVALEPEKSERWVDLAHQYRTVGRREDAVRAFRQALALNPVDGAAWWSLANYFPNEISERDEQAISTALKEHAGSPAEAPLQLTLALIKDRRKEHEQAFNLLLAGKRESAALQPADEHSVSRAVDEIIRIVTAEFYGRRSKAGSGDASPIFIVGMPRAGTTLVERILGQHSSIEAAGELPVLQRCAEFARHRTASPDDYASVLEGLSDAQLSAFGQRYLQASRDYRRTEKPRFIDKSNLNWMHVGLILIAFPNARIIDVRRDAVDCCWANYKVFFPAGFPEANDLHALGRFYAEYARLMDAMAQRFPDRILPVRYEDVVDDIEAETRRMLGFLDLPFEAACLDFHLSGDAVATPSSEQVRQPINRKGIGSSDPYRPWLGPLIDALGPLAKR